MSQTPKELNQLGDQAFYGENQTKNIELAYTYYKQAADMNNPIGLYNLGKYYMAKSEYKLALKQFKKASDLDYSEAYIQLSSMYLEGVGVRKSKKKAFKLIEVAAQFNDIGAYHIIAKMYAEGIGTYINDGLAYEYYLKSAEKNQLPGMYGLGVFLLSKKDKNKAHETAFFWLDKAAQMHYLPAIETLIELYQKPHPYLQKKSQLYLDEMVFHYQEYLAKTKDIDALRLVAKTYSEGKTFLSINYQKSFHYYQCLHELEDLEGYFGLGKHYLYGLGVEKNYPLAKDYLEIASSRNHPSAKTLLGDIYRLGLGVSVDVNTAKEHYLGAAEDQQIDALINLSLLHYRGLIKHANDVQAFTYIERAVQLNHPKAYFWLGLYYENGIGITENIDQAIEAYKQAIQLGSNASRYKLALLLYQKAKSNITKRKKDQYFKEIKTLLMTYIEAIDGDQRLKAIYLLGIFFNDQNNPYYSPKASRYYFELGAEFNDPKAMNRLYEIYLSEDKNYAMEWLQKAIQLENDGESFYLLSIIYEEGLHGVLKDKVKAERYLKAAAQLKYTKAIEKITFKGA